MSRQVERREQLPDSERTTILLHEGGTLDLPYVPLIWGAFNYNLFEYNRKRLLELYSPSISKTRNGHLLDLSDNKISKYLPFLEQIQSGNEVKRNIARSMGIHNLPNFTDFSTGVELADEVENRLLQSTGSVVAMGTSHSLLYPIHRAVWKMARDQSIRVAEFVLDKHIDVVRSNEIAPDVVTSANVYWHLTHEEFIDMPVIFGPDTALMEKVQSAVGIGKLGKVFVSNIADQMEQDDEQKVKEVLSYLQKRGITHLTTCVDMDVVAAEDKIYSVRYSPVMKYLGLGCQVLPNKLTEEDIDAAEYLRYPTSQMQYLLQYDQLVIGQDPGNLRKIIPRLKSVQPENDMHFQPKEMRTDIGVGKGLQLSRSLRIIQIVKRLLPEYAIVDGIPLQTGAVYKGAVVEICGFEDQNRRTSKAAIRFGKIITG